jgi:hypothetical protein
VPSTIRRQIFLDHGRVMIECPRLTSNQELADILAAFVEQVRAKGKPEPKRVEPNKPEPVLKRAKKGSGPYCGRREIQLGFSWSPF